MCGIAGIVDPQLSALDLRGPLRMMTGVIKHRGPDDDGFFVGDGVGLGMRRLSIIDVAGGHQPIGSEDDQIQVICNGEIYNYLELRGKLESRGHVFRTHSDVEVIAHLYEDKGTACFEDLRGMFAAAIWDRRQRRLVLVRDRLGKKPLFYSQRSGRIIFGSEIKSILAAEPGLAEPNDQALPSFFRFGVVPQPQTMFRDIHKLSAGHFLVFEQQRVDIEPYWRLEFSEADGPVNANRNWVEELDQLLEESVRLRLMSEVPLGVFLSGGLDSSTMVAYAHRAGLHPLKTFTIGFDRPEWDESQDAQLVADRFQTEHHVLRLTERELKQDLPGTILNLVRHIDEPFGDVAALPTYFISKLAREHVTVILSGDGGDELFAGYTVFQGLKFAEWYRRLPKWMSANLFPGMADLLCKVLPQGRRYGAMRIARILRESQLPFEATYLNKASSGVDTKLSQLFTESWRRDLLNTPPFPAHIEAVLRSNMPTINKLSYVHTCFHLLERYLVKTDRMSMAHSLEVRSPLLDHKIVEFAARLPTSLKLRGWESKALLRDTVRSLLPAATLRKRKQGFGVPLRDWLRTGLNEMVGDYLESESGGLPSELFDRTEVRAVLRQHRRGVADHSEIIWLMLNYAVWREQYLHQHVAA